MQKNLDLITILKGLKSYPTWTTGNSYEISVGVKNKNTLLIKGYHCSLEFPRFIKITPKLFWLMGFLNGEGTNATNKSGYLRFTITNSNPEFMKMALDILDESKILPKFNIPDKSLKIGRSSLHDDKYLLNFWSKKLELPKFKFHLPLKKDELKKAKYGVCHLYISNVLLRRVTDKIFEYFGKKYLRGKNSGAWNIRV